jgi:hypothetical protein
MTGPMRYEWGDEWDEQAAHLSRVKSRIVHAILTFLRAHKRFRADDLRKYVAETTGIAAPASADRVLRDLRQRKIIDYRVISRRESLYETLYVPPEKA